MHTANRRSSSQARGGSDFGVYQSASECFGDGHQRECRAVAPHGVIG